MKETKDTALPTASALFNPLIKVLGNLINYNTAVGVVRDTLYDSVLAEAGIDVSTTTHPLKGRTGLYRIVQFAHRNQRDGYCGKKRTALTTCLLYTSPSPRDRTRSRMPSSA